MIVIGKNNLEQVGQDYLARLKKHANRFPRRSVGKIVKSLSQEELEALILCPPEKLKSYRIPTGVDIPSKRFVTAYKQFFIESVGEDGVNNALWLVNRLNITVCPYCNRTYTFTVNNRPDKAKRYVRPELDHFFPKSDPAYMHLAISFYNLVPVCPQCNQLKGTNIFDYHPYYGSLIGQGRPRFEVEDVKDSEGKFLFPDKPKLILLNSNSDTDTLALTDLYKQHEDYVKEILDKIQAYNLDALTPLVESFQGLGKTEEEIDRLIWGNYVEEGQLGKRPLSKLTRDLLEQFEVI